MAEKDPKDEPGKPNKPVADPPTLPPFASDGPRPATIHGFPKVDVFADAEDLFSGPPPEPTNPRAVIPPPPPGFGSSGDKTNPRGIAPPLPPLAKVKPASGPLPAAPPISPSVPPAISPLGAGDSGRFAPAVREPTPGPVALDVSGDATGVPDSIDDEASSGALPSANSLIEKIRAAKRKGEDTPQPMALPKIEPLAKARETTVSSGKLPPLGGSLASRLQKARAQADDAATSEADEPQETKAEPEPKAEAKPEPEPPAKPVSDDSPTIAVASAPPKPLPKLADKLASAAKAGAAASLPKLEPKRSDEPDTDVESMATAPYKTVPPSSGDEDDEEEVPTQAIEPSKAWLEPVPLETLDRRPDATHGKRATASEDETTVPRKDDASETTESSETPAKPETTEKPELPAKPETPAKPELPAKPEKADAGEEATVARASKRPVPAPPSTARPLAPPPPPTSATTSEDDDGRPHVVPYVPPAVVLESSALASADPNQTLDDTELDPVPTIEMPARLPNPGVRLPPADPIVAARIAQATSAEPVSNAAIVGVPQTLPTQDTASLVNGLANELIAEAEGRPEPEPERDDAPVITPVPTRSEQDRRRRKFALGFIGAAAVLSIIALVTPSKSDTTDAAADVAESDPAPEPTPDPNSIAEAEPKPEPTPEPTPVAEPTPAAAETGAEPEPEPEPEPEVAAKPEPTTSPGPKRKPKTEDKPEETKPAPKPEPKPAPKPAPKPTTDNRSADELYAAAQSAFSGGRASEAYKLASQSYQKKAKSKTAELMTLAACKLKDAGKANSALNKVTALRRNAMKKECKSLGLSL